MEPTIYKPSIYKGTGIYKTGAEGGDTSIFNILLEQYQGSRGAPTNDNPLWPTAINPLNNRVTTQVIYLNSFVGKKTKIFVQNNSYEMGAIDGTESGAPFNNYSWSDSIEFIIQYGTITVSIRKKDNTDLLPNEAPIYLQLLDD